MKRIIEWIRHKYYSGDCTEQPSCMTVGSEDAKDLERVIREEFPGLNEVREMLRKLGHVRISDSTHGFYVSMNRLIIWDDAEASFGPIDGSMLLTVKPNQDLAKAFREFADDYLAKRSWQLAKQRSWRQDLNYLRGCIAPDSAQGRETLERLTEAMEKMSAENRENAETIAEAMGMVKAANAAAEKALLAEKKTDETRRST